MITSGKLVEDARPVAPEAVRSTPKRSAGRFPRPEGTTASEKSRVYWNTHASCWSVKAGKNPVLHAQALTLENVSFVVSVRGRERVRQTKTKNVHAFAVGTWVLSGKVADWERIRYNPYKNEMFVDTEGRPVVWAARACFTVSGHVYATGIIYANETGEDAARYSNERKEKANQPRTGSLS